MKRLEQGHKGLQEPLTWTPKKEEKNFNLLVLLQPIPKFLTDTFMAFPRHNISQ